jgi:hypothetical protein
MNDQEKSFALFVKKDEIQTKTLKEIIERARKYLFDKEQCIVTTIETQIPIIEDSRTLEYYDDSLPFYFCLKPSYES